MVNELIIGSLALARSSWVGVGMAMHRYYGSVFFFVLFFPAKYVKVALLGRGRGRSFWTCLEAVATKRLM